MSETSLKPVIDKLENLFSKFNEKFYNGELQTPIITVSPDTTKGAYGWCTAWKAWSNKQPEQKKTVDLAVMSKEDLENLKKDEGFYEINICAEHLARPFEQVAETLLHEMVHLYNLQIGVQDTSRGGTYHNKKYKEAAEQHGLTVGKDAKYGWTVTTLLSNSTWVMEHIYFPQNWADRFPDYYTAMSRYQKEGKNAHDDAPDATTGIAEKVGCGEAFSFD